MPNVNIFTIDHDEQEREAWEEQPVTIPLWEYTELRETVAVLENKCNAYLLEANRLREDLAELRKLLDLGGE